MNRLESIKERVKKHRETEHDTPISNQYQFASEVEYLLQRLEIAEDKIQTMIETNDLLEWLQNILRNSENNIVKAQNDGDAETTSYVRGQWNAINHVIQSISSGTYSQALEQIRK